MEKLKLEELAPYLPYGLKLVWNKGVNDIEMHCDNVNHAIRLTNEVENKDDRWKSILRPLSDLTKEIEIDGKKFIPVNKIIKIFRKSLKHLSTEYQIKALNRFRIDLILGKLEYRYTIKVIEWHFDIFGLIKKGLAIDINTLK